ncbi:MAG: hypothetical protein IH985_05585 [Planctomycetes bacterium]|nr:hypothetical protein [Planctomycetota bacterium]
MDDVKYGERWTDRGADWVPADDTVIGRALRRSAIAIGLIGVIVLIGLIIQRSDDLVPIVDDAGVTAPEATADLAAILPPAVRFTDITAEAGIDFVHFNSAEGERLLPETMGGGVAIFDADADGDQDLLFVNSDRWPWMEPASGDRTGSASTARRSSRSQAARSRPTVPTRPVSARAPASSRSCSASGRNRSGCRSAAPAMPTPPRPANA